MGLYSSFLIKSMSSLEIKVLDSILIHSPLHKNLRKIRTISLDATELPCRNAWTQYLFDG